jgi:predicted RNA-binding protein (virulence factor B family)
MTIYSVSCRQNCFMIQAGERYTLKVLRMTAFGCYLDDGADGVLLPKRYVPEHCKVNDELSVFIYHDSEDRIIATTEQPLGMIEAIVKLKVVSVTQQGAFMDWGLSKDLFVPRSQQISKMMINGHYFIKIYRDEQTGRLAGTEKFDHMLSNDELTLKVADEVMLTIYRRTDIGYVVIINNKHTGVLHHSDIFRPISEGDKFPGFIKKIYPEGNKIDVAAGKKGYERVNSEGEKILQLLKTNHGFLPYNDKTDPDQIYDFFAMSKKTFKMTIGGLYKQRIISIESDGIRLLNNQE